MKKTILFFTFIFNVLSYTFSQDVIGDWYGILEIQGLKIHLVLHINKTENGLKATLDSPDQGSFGIPVSSVSYDNNELKLAVNNINMEYVAHLTDANNMKGDFKQMGMALPLSMSKEKVFEPAKPKPQEPVAPYPYYSEEVTFENPIGKFNLAGTLTLPQKEGKFPVVILISGSGAQNRNEELLGHKPFLVISDYLTRNGIGVLRYDDRGTAESKGDFKSATTADFATDVEAAIAYLKTRKEVNQSKIGLVGHSEGGMIAPIVASQSKDVAYIVLLAGPGMKCDDLLTLQSKLIAKASGESDKNLEIAEKINKQLYEILKKDGSTDDIKKEASNFLLAEIKKYPEAKPKDISDEDFVKMELRSMTSSWMRYFLKFDPMPYLSKVKCPVLALNGEKDLQVPPKENLEGIKKGLEKAKNKNVTTKELVGLNHLFQECKTGSPAEYSMIEQTFSPIALKELSDWILKQIK